VRRAPSAQFIRFLLVGVLNAAIGYALFVMFSAAGLSAGPALALTYVFGSIANFFTTGGLVFRASNPRLIFRFLATYVVVYFVNLACLHGLMTMGTPKLLAQAILVPFVAVLSFLLFKSFVFTDQQ
jgi:putative flippase GtrA